MKQTIIIIAIILAVGIGAYIWYSYSSVSHQAEELPIEQTEVDEQETETVTDEEEDAEEPTTSERGPQSTIGTSAGGNPITAYHFGEGDTELLFVGGTHGGYSANTSLVAFALIDYLEANPNQLPNNLTVTVIPVLNPDGLAVATNQTSRFTIQNVTSNTDTRIASRFNANNVDINRNFGCEWQAEGTWQNRTVSGGSEAFSEPEAQAIRNYVNTHQPAAAVVWYSAAGGVYASECRQGILPETRTIMNQFANASGYPANDSFDFYAITGDMVNWFASQNIPAISVLLTDRDNPEWDKNRAGIEALLNHFAR